MDRELSCEETHSYHLPVGAFTSQLSVLIKAAIEISDLEW